MNNNNETKMFRQRRVYKDPCDVVVAVFERTTNSLGHFKTGPRPHPTDWCLFGAKNISALNGLWLFRMYKN